MASKERILTDHEEIRRWAEARGARPAVVKGTGGDDDPGILRLMFPGYSESDEESLEETSWDEFFRKFDESNLALVVQDRSASGERSNFNKLVSRDTLEERKLERSRARRTRTRPSATARRARRTGTGRGRGQRRSAGRTSSRARSTARAASSNRSSRRQASRSTRASSSSRSQRTTSGRRSQQSQSGRSASSGRKIRSERAKTGVRGKKRGASERSRREAA